MYVESQNGILLSCPLQSCNLCLQSELGLRGLSRLFRLGVCRSSWLGRPLISSSLRNIPGFGMRSQCRLVLLCWCRRGYTRYWERVLSAMQAVGRLRGVRERGDRSIGRDAPKGRAIMLGRGAWSIAPWGIRRVFGLVYRGAIVHDEAFVSCGHTLDERQYWSRYWRRTASLGEVGVGYERFSHDCASLMPQSPVRRRLKMDAQS